MSLFRRRDMRAAPSDSELDAAADLVAARLHVRAAANRVAVAVFRSRTATTEGDRLMWEAHAYQAEADCERHAAAAHEAADRLNQMNQPEDTA